jgi:hypothetical protein
MSYALARAQLSNIPHNSKKTGRCSGASSSNNLAKSEESDKHGGLGEEHYDEGVGVETAVVRFRGINRIVETVSYEGVTKVIVQKTVDLN